MSSASDQESEVDLSSSAVTQENIEGDEPTKERYSLVRKIICRYGRGCTHQDPIHKERFWHPPVPVITDEQLRTHYICNECGQALSSLQELQVHLQRKTAWSNASLVGCRISCLVDYKEWHEGFVTQFHKSGKHYVEFRQIGEKRWLNMIKIAFYIVERPQTQRTAEGEFKDGNDVLPHEEGGGGGGAGGAGAVSGIDTSMEDWVFVEDLTLDYAFAQSVLFKVYGSVLQETGHKTRGHVCLTEDDKDNARFIKGSLLYGELLPRGANKAFGPKRLAVEKASVLFDLGMGTGKIAIQAFLQYRNVDYVYGVELSAGRYRLAEEAALRMVHLLGVNTFKVQVNPGRCIIITETALHEEGGRVLHLECGNMFDVTNIEIADVVMLETDIPIDLHQNLCQLLSGMHEGSRTLTYLDLRKIWGYGPFPFKQLESNRHLSDRFPTSWSVQRGHHFLLWSKVKATSSSLLTGPVFSSTQAGYQGNMSREGSFERDNSREDVSGSSSSGVGGRRRDASRGQGGEEVNDSGCFPSFSISSMFGFRGSSKRSRQRKNVSEHEKNNQIIIPLNADGSRSIGQPPLPRINTRRSLDLSTSSDEQDVMRFEGGGGGHIDSINNITSIEEAPSSWRDSLQLQVGTSSSSSSSSSSSANGGKRRTTETLSSPVDEIISPSGLGFGDDSLEGALRTVDSESDVATTPTKISRPLSLDSPVYSGGMVAGKNEHIWISDRGSARDADTMHTPLSLRSGRCGGVASPPASPSFHQQHGSISLMRGREPGGGGDSSPPRIEGTSYMDVRTLMYPNPNITVESNKRRGQASGGGGDDSESPLRQTESLAVLQSKSNGGAKRGASRCVIA